MFLCSVFSIFTFLLLLRLVPAHIKHKDFAITKELTSALFLMDTAAYKCNFTRKDIPLQTFERPYLIF